MSEARSWSSTSTACGNQGAKHPRAGPGEVTIYRGNNIKEVGSSVTRGTNSQDTSLPAPQVNDHHEHSCFPLIS